MALILTDPNMCEPLDADSLKGLLDGLSVYHAAELCVYHRMMLDQDSIRKIAQLLKKAPQERFLTFMNSKSF